MPWIFQGSRVYKLGFIRRRKICTFCTAFQRQPSRRCNSPWFSRSVNQFEPWDLLALNASYNFAVVKFLASVGVVDAADERITDWQIGFDYPVSKALTVSAGYAYSEDNDELGGGNRKGFGVGATYNLADTTTLYGGYRQSEARDGGDWLYEQQKSNVVSIGIKHTF